jgi:hypothetical protein
MLTPAQVRTQIITGGISCLPACSGGLITANIFSLAGCFEIVVKPVGPTGGSYPLAPGAIHDLYQPVGEPSYLVRPEDRKLFNDARSVVIRVKLGDFETEKEYLVTPRRANMVVRIINFLNKTEEKFRATASNFTRMSKNVVRALNFRKKR